jgi:hypothetical protein
MITLYVKSIICNYMPTLLSSKHYYHLNNQLFTHELKGEDPPGGGSELLLDDLDEDGVREWVLTVIKGGDDCRCSSPFWLNFFRILRPAPRGVLQV